MYYKILIEPAKSSKSTCHNCKSTILQNTLRIKVVDARKFNAFIQKQGRQNISCEGLSRGYFECAGPRGQHISIEKYFVHMNCYEPLEPHPFEKKYFDPQKFKTQHHLQFQRWLNQKSTQQPGFLKKTKGQSVKGQNQELLSSQRKQKQNQKKQKKSKIKKEKPRKTKKTKGISKTSKLKSKKQ